MSVFNFPAIKVKCSQDAPPDHEQGSWTQVISAPKPVRNLRVAASDPNEPSVTVTWDPPLDSCSIASYEVRFSSDCVYMTGVDSHTTSVCITREMGLEPLRLCQFEVRAKKTGLLWCGGKWSKVSQFVGM